MSQLFSESKRPLSRALTDENHQDRHVLSSRMLNKTPFLLGAKSPSLSLELLHGHRRRQMLPCPAGLPAQRVEAGRSSAVSAD